MFYFCRMWAGISSRSGLNASLSHYKDRYIIERGGRNRDERDDRCEVQTRVQTFVANRCTSLANVVSSPMHTCTYVCNV